ncbi:MAG: methyltransferase domain-containing protein [Myxococcota bacterium]|nr:methyltransferase domain-containing protein [Myxococcota bacterium]
MTTSPLPLAQADRMANATIPVFARWFGSWQLSIERRALSLPELSQRYDRSAADWNRALDRMGFPEAYEALWRRVLREEGPAALGEGDRVLDCGVGTGALSGALARVSKSSFALDAIDISPRMLERAAVCLAESGQPVTLRQGDVCALPYADDSFDLVMTAHVLEHVVDPALALSEMVRVLRPGGWLVASVTRRSLLSMWIHLKWHTHRVAAPQAERLLRESGLCEVRSLRFEEGAVCHRLSLPCIGRKPAIDTDTRRDSL